MAGRKSLESLRASEHRTFISPEFGVGAELPPEADPVGLTYFQIMADPKLAYLGRTVFEKMQTQFAGEAGDAPSGAEDEAYRMRLESWADALELMLDEVLNELATLGERRPAPQDLI